MNWFSLEAIFGITMWCLPAFILTLLAGKFQKLVFTVICRVLYFPYLLFLLLPFFWFWAGDGATNLWLVPLCFGALFFGSLKFFKRKLERKLRTLDLILFLAVFSAYGTLWLTVAVHQFVIGTPLRIA